MSKGQLTMESYNISELASETGLTAHTLRYYEREALIPKVPRDGSGRRCYKENHLKGIKFIKALRSTGMRIRDIKRYLELINLGEKSKEDRLDLLKAHRSDVRAQLDQIRESLKIVDRKIKAYEDGLY
jgi:DNA-binding transcriptional MerR regulator